MGSRAPVMACSKDCNLCAASNLIVRKSFVIFGRWETMPDPRTVGRQLRLGRGPDIRGSRVRKKT
eukprot:7062956-Pyramimonas_sp.AAC.1